MDDFKSIIGKVATGATLSRDEAASAFDSMMSGEATPSQMGGLLMALRVRGETVDEITGAVSAMRAKMLRVKAPANAVDVVGTGGDGSGSVNVSTCASFIVAGTGDPVLLLHGGFCSIESLRAQSDALVPDHRVYAFERPGHGRSADIDGDYGYARMVADTLAYLDAVGLESAHVVGYSDGAIIGLLLALDHPGRVRSLTGPGASKAWSSTATTGPTKSGSRDGTLPHSDGRAVSSSSCV